MQQPGLPIGAFLAAFLTLIPAFWHWRARNVATLSLVAWLFILNVIYGVNSIIWAGNILNPVPVWCDISTKLVIGGSSALPACSLCICKYLELIGSNRKGKLDGFDRRRIAIFDFSLCWGVPIVLMALHNIVQGHRFDILEDIGCQPTTYYSIPAIFIVWLPPLLLSVATLVYAGLSLYHFTRLRVTFSSILQTSNSSMTTNRYLRLIAMSVTEMMWGTTLTSVTIWANSTNGLRPWTNWSFVHSNWNRADAYIWLMISPFSQRVMFLLWWAIPISAYIFFAFFGFGEDALKEYRKLGIWLSSRISQRFNRNTSRFGLSSRSTDSYPIPPPQYTPTVPSASNTSSDEKTIDVSSPSFEKLTISSIDSIRVTRDNAYSAFYYNPTSSPANSPSVGSRFSISDDHIAYGRPHTSYSSSRPPSLSASPTTSHFNVQSHDSALSPFDLSDVSDHERPLSLARITPIQHPETALTRSRGSILVTMHTSNNSDMV